MSRALPALLLALALLAAACGGSESTATTDTSSPAAGTTEATETAEGDPVSVEGVNGTLKLDEPADRVVALEFTYAEDLLAVDVPPVGVADIATYNDFVNIEPELPADTTDVGTRQEPSLEAISALDPDLIIGVAFRHEPVLDQLEAIAPTVLFNPYPTGGELTQFEEMTQTFETIATAVGRSERAEEVLAEMEATFDDAQAQLGDAQLATDAFALAQGFSAEEVPTIRMFTDNAMAVQILERIGLSNAWEGELEEFGFNTVDVEALTAVSDANFLYSAQSEDDIFTGAFADNPIWQDLEFVAEERVYALGGDTWLFGGPLSAELVATTTADLLSSS